MKVVLAGIGRLKAGPERDLFDRYIGRSRAMARSAGLTLIDVFEADEGRGRTADERKREEAAALAARLPAECHLMTFEESGRSMTSTAFAGLIGRSRDTGVPCFAFAIGGPDGFDDTVRKRADVAMSFGTATLPHQLVRILVAEQFYRALTILAGHPYHRA